MSIGTNHFHEAEHVRLAREIEALQQRADSLEMTPDERRTLQAVASRYLTEGEKRLARKEWWQTTQARLAFAGGISVGIMQGVSMTHQVFGWF